MPEITATKTMADMSCAKPHTLMPGGVACDDGRGVRLFIVAAELGEHLVE